MRRWFVGMALAWGFTAGFGQAQQVAPAQAPVQVQIEIRADPVIQLIEPGNLRADVVIGGMPGFGAGVNRFTQSDIIVVGRVIAFEPMDVEAPQGPNQPNANYRVAIVQLSEAIHGVKKDTQTIRVAFLAPSNAGPNGGGVQILPAVQQGNFQLQPGLIGGRRPFVGYVQLQMGQDGIFMGTKHHKENFYTLANYTSFVNRQNNANFDNEVRTAKQLSKVMDNPIAALKADDLKERVLSAAILIARYRNPINTTGAAMKQEPIDADESKLILAALAQGDWSIARASDAMPYGPEMFNQLGITQKDGYNPINVRNQQEIVKAMQTWLTENSDKYRIQKFVVDPNAKPGLIPADLPANPQPGVIRPIVRPLPIKIQPIKGKIQILPAPPVPVPDLPPQLDDAPVQNAVPVPLRRE